MSTKQDILKLSGQISAIDFNLLLFHKYRFQALLRRVKVIVDLVCETEGVDPHVPTMSQPLILLSITLEEILQYVLLFTTKDNRLASHIIKYGSDEEQFVKWNERLQHCAMELKLNSKVFDAFDEIADLKDFQKDVDHLQSEIINVVVLLHGGDNKLIAQSLEGLLAPDSELEINPKKIKYDKVIGHGGFGVVWSARYKGEPVAVKTIPIQALTKQSIAALNAEANLMRRLAHPRIVSCFGVFENEGNHCIIMELMEFGSLHDYIAEKPSPEYWLLRYTIAVDICHGMSYLHRLNVIHRDLKPGNVVLDRYMRGKITDFGISLIKNTAAPECFGLAPLFSAKSDVFSFSVIMWELAHWRFVYAGISFLEIRDSIRANDRLAIDTGVPKLVAEMIRNCWDANPKMRPAFSTLSKIIDDEITFLNISFPGKLELLSHQNTDTSGEFTKMTALPRKKTANLPYRSKFQSIRKRTWILICSLVILVLAGLTTAIVIIIPSKLGNATSSADSSTIEKTRTLMMPSLSVSSSFPLVSTVPNSILSSTTSMSTISTCTNSSSLSFTTTASTILSGTLTSNSIITSTKLPSIMTSDVISTLITSSSLSTSTTSIDFVSTSSSSPSTTTTSAIQNLQYHPNTGNVTTFATGISDLRAIAIAPQGTLYFPRNSLNIICKYDKSGGYSVIAGNVSGTPGFVNANGLSASFRDPAAVAVGSNGSIYVVEGGNHVIRKIDSMGNVTTFAGLGYGGFLDGPSNQALFNNPRRIIAGLNGEFYVSEYYNNAIRKVDANGYVTTIAGNGTLGFTDKPGLNATFNRPLSMANDYQGGLIVADTNNNCIRRINSTGYVTTYAGNGTAGFMDGQGLNAMFFAPKGLLYDPNLSVLYVSDANNNAIRDINSTGYVSLLAGSPSGAAGTSDGVGASATFNSPDFGYSLDSDGSFYVCDVSGGTIRKIV